ncbi:hypothetical protein [Bacillus sp. 1P06AnD]|uniref:hypothetical protein n=1 Tax=Bacillus sp. 1P06AnD TaxID=3132208 RepID=UPI0039A2E2B4
MAFFFIVVIFWAFAFLVTVMVYRKYSRWKWCVDLGITIIVVFPIPLALLIGQWMAIRMHDGFAFITVGVYTFIGVVLLGAIVTFIGLAAPLPLEERRRIKSVEEVQESVDADLGEWWKEEWDWYFKKNRDVISFDIVHKNVFKQNLKI